MAIVDKYGEIVSTDDSSTITIVIDANFNTNVSYSAAFEGNAIYKPQNGMFHIEDVQFKAEPGTSHRLLFTTSGIDTTKPSNVAYLQEQNTTSAYFALEIHLRECLLGEQFTSAGK